MGITEAKSRNNTRLSRERGEWRPVYEWRRTVLLIAMGTTVALSGCGESGTASPENQTTESSVVESIPGAESGETAGISAGAESEGSDGTSSDGSDVSDTAGTTEAAISADSVLPSELADGEQVLGSANSVQVPLQGEAPEIEVNWANMPDTVAWLAIPGTNISTGILEKESEGHIWLDENSTVNFSDPMTVVHGSYDSGEPLEQITSYGDEQFFRENPYVYVYTPDGQVLEYKVFASYEHAHEDILVEHNPYDYDEFGSYIDSIYREHSMGIITDEDLHDTVISTWQVLTIDAESGQGDDFILQTTLTGQEKQE